MVVVVVQTKNQEVPRIMIFANTRERRRKNYESSFRLFVS